MTPAECYRQQLQQGELYPDHGQQAAVAQLQQLFCELNQSPQNGLWQRLLRRVRRPAAATRGLYLWGGVGRGKTQLMDLFFHCLPPGTGQRLHFHRFMHIVHLRLRALSGRKNPLQSVAAEFSSRNTVLCLDEFHVTDIGDAMILGNLLTALFANGVLLVTTSNTAPQQLYRDGLQRQRFLPAIALLEQHCEVAEIAAGTDYRLRTLEQAPLYFCPADKAAEARLAERFDDLAPGFSDSGGDDITLNDRSFPVRRLADDVVWFDFATLCGGPRSQDDYLEMVREFHAVLLSDVPILDAATDSSARRFIHLVDILYDHRVKLVLSAAAQPRELYRGQQLRAAFDRTSSRLTEMQTHDYLAAAHRS